MSRRRTITENMTKIELKSIEQGISRRELARRSGVPLSTLENWSMRTRLPRDVYQLHKVAQALGCTIEDIMEPEPTEDTTEAPEAPEGGAQIINRYYLTQRPPMPGAFPRSPINVVDFGEKKSVPELGRDAWGYVEYKAPLTPDQINDYELKTAPACFQ